MQIHDNLVWQYTNYTIDTINIMYSTPCQLKSIDSTDKHIRHVLLGILDIVSIKNIKNSAEKHIQCS
jgi:hypothetical protein